MNQYSQDNTPFPFSSNLLPFSPYLDTASPPNLLNQMMAKLQYQAQALNPYTNPQSLIYQQLAQQQSSLQNYQLYCSALLQLKQQQDTQLLQQSLLANLKREDDLTIKPASPSPSQLSSITAPSKTSQDKPIAALTEDPKPSSILKQTKKIVKAPKNIIPDCDSASSQEEKGRKTRKIWTHAEDTKLLALIEKYGMKWTDIGREIGGRTGKQVRDRYLNNLRSDLTNTPWTQEEDELLKALYYILGSKWCVVALYLPGRSEAQVKNRFYKQIKGELRPEEDKQRIINIILNWRKNFLEGDKKDLPAVKTPDASQGLLTIEEVLTLLYHKKDISNIYISRKLINNMPLLDLLLDPEEEDKESGPKKNITGIKKEEAGAV